MKLHREAAKPLYKQLEADLVRSIRSGRFRPGQRIPSEREICATYGVSRTTVRQTMSDLVASGLLIRVPARGTFVASPKIDQDLTRVVRFSEAVAAAGYRPSARLLGIRTVPAPPPASQALGLPAGEPVVVVDMLSLGDGAPLAFYRIHLPVETGDPTARALLAAEAEGRVTFGLVLEHVRRVCGLEPAQVVQTYEAAPAPEEIARVLGIPEGAAIVASARTVLTASGVPITHDQAYYRGDRYRFTIRRAYSL
ncbi:MAG: GntR family transcriptional regulator [Armatimonadota bacterium]|nr:GntR family transcriptional regulator [Armatimonadota bacterium]MDR7518575.1 GntR family transcriptional regulator [Armatimonadota bacterium]MDR7549694.1 GntR family transcriptional regulator [Armatimonadota bacterium]